MSAERSTRIPLCAPRLDGNEARYLAECVESGWVSSAGPFVERLEAALAGLVGVPEAVATSSGTAALHLALCVAGVEAGDEVLVPALSFVAPANAVRYVGALPVFLDAEPTHAQLDPAALARFLEERCVRSRCGLRNRETGRRVAALIAVHVLGHPVDLDAILELARGAGLVLIEDAAEALGAHYRGAPIGSFGDLACFSFNGNKTVTAGGGGMLVAADPEQARRARHLSTQAKRDPVEFVHDAVGFNYRLSNLQAAVGCAQLERIDELLADKRRVARGYARALADVPGIVAFREADWARSSHWLTGVRVVEERFGMPSRGLLAWLDARGIETRPLWQPLHRSPAHAGSSGPPCPVAERLARETLCLPSSCGLAASELEYVAGAIRAASRVLAA